MALCACCGDRGRCRGDGVLVCCQAEGCLEVLEQTQGLVDVSCPLLLHNHHPAAPLYMTAWTSNLPDDKVRWYLVYLKYSTLNLKPLMVCPKVLFPLNFIIKE